MIKQGINILFNGKLYSVNRNCLKGMYLWYIKVVYRNNGSSINTLNK